ncbi:hypothetical protein [Scytonema sp. NUACC26]|uniref:hypothetical protein n=1 Tax=Scytonema sp. NUACC26 TaxID=3140176 RepID=UPI0038B2BAC9
MRESTILDRFEQFVHCNELKIQHFILVERWFCYSSSIVANEAMNSVSLPPRVREARPNKFNTSRLTTLKVLGSDRL